MFRHSCLLAALFLAGACAEPEPLRADYFPTLPGYQWEYDISRKTPIPLEPVLQKSIVLNLKAETRAGVRRYPKRYANGGKRFFIKSATGVWHDGGGENGRAQLIAYPPEPGTEWSAPSRLYLFDLPKKLDEGRKLISRDLTLDYAIASRAETVDVPAGRFFDCLRIDAVGFLDLPRRLMLGIKIIKVKQTEWYAPGVGLIKKTRQEYALPNLYPGEYTQVLTAFRQK